jgi:hypothetical protein
VAWAPDSGAVYFTADDHGRRPVFHADLATGQVARLTPAGPVLDHLTSVQRIILALLNIPLPWPEKPN